MIPLQQVPEGVLAIGEELANDLEIKQAANVMWSLRTEGIAQVRANELTIEATVDHQLDHLVDELAQSEGIAGRLLWIPVDKTAGTLFLEINGKPFRVRDLSPRTASDSIVEITTETELRVFAPGYKSGIDIVILADCSGSMNIDDLTDEADYVPQTSVWNLFRTSTSGLRSLPRIEALRRALNQLLETRLRVTGRMSRIALVAFTTVCSVRFPRSGGMAEFDENASDEVIREFRDAINLLQAEKAGTDIGQAIYNAAELLYRHGRPNNDRLIVLISDGANWKPKGQEATGEMVHATQEPVSLMEHLHREMKIGLHAIGISTEAIFMDYYRGKHGLRNTPDISSIPNHALLEQLVLVGGGDPAETGDTNVLQRYLTGLGAGVTRSVGKPRSPSTPILQPHELAILAAIKKRALRVSTTTDVEVELATLKNDIKKLRDDCNGYMGSSPAFRSLFLQTDKMLEAVDRYMVRETQSVEDFTLFINNLSQCFWESLDKKVKNREVNDEPAPIPTVAQIIHKGLRPIRLLRNYYVHDKERELDGGAKSEDRRDHEQRVAFVEYVVGEKYIQDDDAVLWSRLQRGVLVHLRETLKTAVGEFKKKADLAGKPDAPGKDQPDFVWKW